MNHQSHRHSTGTPLLNSFGYGVVLTSWIKFIFFVGIPALTLVSLLLSGNQEFLQVTLVTTFLSVSSIFLFFSANVIWFRVSSCLYLVQELYKREDMTNAERFKCTILTAEESMLSGKIHKNYIYLSNIYDLKRLESNYNTGGASDKELSLYSTDGQWYIKFTQLMPRGLFTTLDLPLRCWTQAEIDFNIPFYTEKSWSLESTFCRQRYGNLVAVLSGPSALRPTQTFSSLVCYFFGAIFYILLVAGLLVFAQVGSVVIAVSVSLCVAYWLSRGRNKYKMFKHWRLQQDGKEEEINDKNDNYHNAHFQKWETYTITKPTSAFAWASFIFKNIFVSMIPFSYFCYSRNAVSAITYLVLFALCFDKKYFDIGPIVERLGSFGTLGMEPGASLAHEGLLGAKTKKEWQHKSRLYHMTRMNSNASRRIWS